MVINKLNTKSQISLEFVMLLGISLMMLVVFIVFTTQNLASANEKKEYIMVKEIAEYVQKEIFITYNTVNGYSRKFEIPTKLRNDNYNISIDDEFLYVEYKDKISIVKIPKVEGNIQRGENQIIKENNEIYLNQI